MCIKSIKLSYFSVRCGEEHKHKKIIVINNHCDSVTWRFITFVGGLLYYIKMLEKSDGGDKTSKSNITGK